MNGSDDAGVVARPNRQQIRSERSTNALLEAAADLIVEGGLESLTFAAVGERAGYSRGLATARFGSKDGLLDALIERIVTTWSHKNILPRIEGCSGLEGVVAMIDAIRAQGAKDPRGLRVLYSLMFEAIGPDERLRCRFAAFHQAMRGDFAQLVGKGQRDGSISGEPSPEAEGVLIVSGLRGVGYQWLLDPGDFDPVDALVYLRDTTEARLSTTR